MKKRTRIILGLTSFFLVSCARPATGASPFEALAEKFEKQSQLPDGPALAPSFEILPDAELVYGPSTAAYSITYSIKSNSTLVNYAEVVDEKTMTGVEILEKIARDYSVNPRLLLTILEYQTGGLTQPDGNITEYPFINDDPACKGLFRQLSWLANELNRGFYTRRVGGLERFTTTDGVEVITSPDANDASAAVQYALGRMLAYHDWLTAVGPLGIRAQYVSLFGEMPNTDSSSDALGVTQPELALPFAEWEGWFFTSGPHSAWGSGAAWAALDFAPDEDGYGCYDSDAWVLAAADGPIVRAEDGIVVQDLDGDGFMGTGWTILYMHIAELERAQVGEYLTAGGRIGHPSCEGGPASGTHLHLARRYNGEWIPADQDIPFILSGWVSAGAGVEYDGTLSRGGISVEASGFPTDENKVTR